MYGSQSCILVFRSLWNKHSIQSHFGEKSVKKKGGDMPNNIEVESK